MTDALRKAGTEVRVVERERIVERIVEVERSSSSSSPRSSSKNAPPASRDELQNLSEQEIQAPRENAHELSSTPIRRRSRVSVTKSINLEDDVFTGPAHHSSDEPAREMYRMRQGSW